MKYRRFLEKPDLTFVFAVLGETYKLLSRSNSPYGLHETEPYHHDDAKKLAVYFGADIFVADVVLADMVVADLDLFVWPIWFFCCG